MRRQSKERFKNKITHNTVKKLKKNPKSSHMIGLQTVKETTEKYNIFINKRKIKVKASHDTTAGSCSANIKVAIHDSVKGFKELQVC